MKTSLKTDFDEYISNFNYASKLETEKNTKRKKKSIELLLQS